MGRTSPYQPHKLFVAALIAREHEWAWVRSLVTEVFGEIDGELPPRPFEFSDYYNEEMGSNIERALFSIGELADPGALAAFKERSNELERRTARANGTRTLNLDPGLLSLSRVMLATTKASAHRVPLRDGFYAEITLLYRHGSYRPLEWTYPDFQSAPFLEWLAGVRSRYHDQLRALDPRRPWRL